MLHLRNLQKNHNIIWQPLSILPHPPPFLAKIFRPLISINFEKIESPGGVSNYVLVDSLLYTADFRVQSPKTSSTFDHNQPITIKVTFSFPEFVSVCKKSA